MERLIPLSHFRGSNCKELVETFAIDDGFSWTMDVVELKAGSLITVNNEP